MPTCTSCKLCKPTSEFYEDRRHKVIRPRSVCIACERLKRSDYRKRPNTKLLRKARKHRRRAAMNQAEGVLGLKVIRAVLLMNEIQHGQLSCTYCLCPIAKSWTLEHKHPVSRGGTNLLGNLALACGSCNSAKGAKTVQEFLAA